MMITMITSMIMIMMIMMMTITTMMMIMMMIMVMMAVLMMRMKMMVVMMMMMMMMMMMFTVSIAVALVAFSHFGWTACRCSLDVVASAAFRIIIPMYVTGDDVNRFLDDQQVPRLSHGSGVIMSKKLKKRKGAFAIVR